MAVDKIKNQLKHNTELPALDYLKQGVLVILKINKAICLLQVRQKENQEYHPEAELN